MLTLFLQSQLVQKVLHWLIPALLLLTLIGAGSWYLQHVQSERDLAKANLVAAELNLGTALTANKSQQETIESLNKFREIDSTTIVQMYADNQSLNKLARTQTETRKALGAQNVQVQAFLSTPVPVELRRLLNGPAPATGDGYPNREGVSAGSAVATTGRTGPH